MRIYISGPITGITPAHAQASFLRAVEILQAKGISSINPEESLRNVVLEHDEYLRINLAMLRLCDGILLLPDYEQSRGALMELGMAMALDKEIYLLEGDEIVNYGY